MKTCSKCGAQNADERIFCIDCDKKLGDKLCSFEEQEQQKNLDITIEKLYNKTDPLHVSQFDKTMGIIALVGAFASLILLIISKFSQRDFTPLWFGIVLFSLSAIEAFVPKITWTFEKVRLSFLINDVDDATPSDFYRICRKTVILISTIIGIMILAITSLEFRYPPVRKYITDIASVENVILSIHTQDYINANLEKWQKIIHGETHTIKIFISELEKAKDTGLEERLMMDAIIEISDRDNMYYTNKDDILFAYYTYGWEEQPE